MTTRPAALAILLVVGVLVPSVSADETTFCNGYITRLPHTITSQGHYCLDRNLSTGMTTGAAITIAADSVVLDLNHFKLAGSAGLATTAIGIEARNRNHITVRNGHIRGFAHAIKLYGDTTSSSALVPSSTNNLIENNALDGNTVHGIWLQGIDNTVRNNVITNTGGSTAVPHPYFSFTLAVNSAYDEAGQGTLSGANVLGNTVSRTIPRVGGGGVHNIAAIVGGSVVVGNTVYGETPNAYGITSGLCKDNIVNMVGEGAIAYSCGYMVGATNFATGAN